MPYRLPNGYGSVTRMPGNRRKPFRVRKTISFSIDPETKVCKQESITIGYFATRKEALEALSEYNRNPYDIKTHTMTLQELYEKWSAEHFAEVSVATVQSYKAAWLVCAPVASLQIKDIKLDQLQNLIDNSGKNRPALQNVKVVLSLMYDYAVRREILTPDRRSMISYLSLKKAGNPNSKSKTNFNAEEIQNLWKTDGADTALILNYTGMRIGELLELKKENVNLKEQYLHIGRAKTTAGIRDVPIADRIVPIFKKIMQSDGDTFLSDPDGKPWTYGRYALNIWNPLMKTLGASHTPHEARHTFISRMTQAGVDERVIKQIVGHKGAGVTEQVYTHIDMKTKLEAVNLLN